MAYRIREVSLGGVFSRPDYPRYSDLPWVEPFSVEGYETKLRSGNIIHPILGSRVPAVTFRPARVRTGTLKLHFRTTRSAMECETLHVYGRVLTLTHRPERTDDQAKSYEQSALGDATEMMYVVSGEITRARTEVDTWTVDVDYQEVRGPNANRPWGIG